MQNKILIASLLQIFMVHLFVVYLYCNHSYLDKKTNHNKFRGAPNLQCLLLLHTVVLYWWLKNYKEHLFRNNASGLCEANCSNVKQTPWHPFSHSCNKLGHIHLFTESFTHLFHNKVIHFWLLWCSRPVMFIRD